MRTPRAEPGLCLKHVHKCGESDQKSVRDLWSRTSYLYDYPWRWRHAVKPDHRAQRRGDANLTLTSRLNPT